MGKYVKPSFDTGPFTDIAEACLNNGLFETSQTLDELLNEGYTGTKDWAVEGRIFKARCADGDFDISVGTDGQTLTSMSPNAPSIAALQAIKNPVAGRSVYLSAGGRSGQFVWKLGDFTDEVAADTQQGIYIASSLVDVTVGCWVRKYAILTLEMFGAGETSDDTAAFNAVEVYCSTYGADIHGTPGATYTLSDEVVLGSSYPSGKEFTIYFNGATCHTTGEFTGLICLLGQVEDVVLTTDGDMTNAATIGIEFGRYPDYPLTNYSGKSNKNISGGSEFYNLIKSEIELDNLELDGVTYFKDVGDAVITLTGGNPDDGSRSANPKITGLHLANPSKDSTYESGSPDVGLRLTATEDAVVRGIINSYDVTFDSSGTSGGTGNNVNLDYAVHRDPHPADAAQNCVLFEVSTAYSVGDYVSPTSESGSVGYIFKCTTAGTTDTSEPTWDETYGNTTTSGTAVFENVLYVANFKLGNDVNFVVSGAVHSVENALFVLESATEINLKNFKPSPLVFASQNGGYASYISAGHGCKISGDFDSSIAYYFSEGVTLSDFLGFTDGHLGGPLSSAYSAPRKVTYKNVTGNYTTTIDDEVIYVSGTSADVTITINAKTRSGQQVKVVNCQNTYNVIVAATYNFVGSSTATLTALGDFADCTVRYYQQCIIASNVTPI